MIGCVLAHLVVNDNGPKQREIILFDLPILEHSSGICGNL